jgi:hypothetical protein
MGVINWPLVLSFMDVKRQTEEVPTWLYRADTVAETEPSRETHALADIRAEVWSPRASDEQPQWTTSFKRKTSVPSFLEELQHHLKKITLPRETYLVSMTPNLEWAIHRTGQKCRQGSWFHEPGQSALAVIDTHELSNSEGTIALRVTDIIAYADAHNMDGLFDAEARKWAANCDEYVAINVIPSTALVKRMPWSDLYRPDLPLCLIPELFTTSFTLGWWRQKLEKDDSPLHQVAVKIANFAQKIVEAGPPNTNLRHDDAISLIACASDWGYKAASDRSRLISAAMLHAKINAMKEDFDRLYVQV